MRAALPIAGEPTAAYGAHMRMNLKKLTAAAALAVIVPLAAACSSGDSGTGGGTGTGIGNGNGSGAGDIAAYCDALKNMQSDGAGMAPGDATDPDAINRLLPAFKKIEAVAPAEVKAEWGKVVSVLEKAKSGDISSLATEAKEMAEGMRKVGTHAQEHCKLSVN